MKDCFELYEEYSRYGYITHECPECRGDCEPSEIDNDEAWCDNCSKPVNVIPLA